MLTFRSTVFLHLPVFLALSTALLACGGGSSGGEQRTIVTSTPAGPGSAIFVATQAAGPSPSVTTANCPRITSPNITAPVINGADVQATSNVLRAVDPVHSFAEFARLPDFFMWSLRSSSDRIDMLSLGGSVHETNHKIDASLRNLCNSDGLARFFAEGRVYVTDMRKTDQLANYSIASETYPAALKTTRAFRYDVYIPGSASSSGNDFSVLLDELNAYSGGANFEAKLLANTAYAQLAVNADSDVGGMADFMLFMQAYLKSARLNHPATYSTLQAQGRTKAYMQYAWSRAEGILAVAYPYTTAAASGNAIKVPVDVLRVVYSADFLQELDGLGIMHKTAADFNATYFR